MIDGDRSACACSRWTTALRDWNNVQARARSTAAQELMPTLEHETAPDWSTISRCRVCARRWRLDRPMSEMHGGGPLCIFWIDPVDEAIARDDGEGLTRRLRERAEDIAFADGLGEERAAPRCRTAECGRGTVESSVFCRDHHFQNVKGRPFPGFARR